MTRFQRLAAATVIASFVLVVIGVAVRATDSGVACPHWPGCFEGRSQQWCGNAKEREKRNKRGSRAVAKKKAPTVSLSIRRP